MSRHPAAAALLALSVIALAACGTATAGQPTAAPTAQVTVTETQTETSENTATVTATATVTEQPSAAPMPSAPPQWPSNTPTPQAPPATEAPAPDLTPQTDQEIRAETLDAVSVTETYWQKLFSSWNVQWWTPSLYRGDGFLDSSRGEGYRCGQDYDPDPNAGACGDQTGRNTTLYWNMSFLRQYSHFGDGVYYVTVAHEYGHAAQYRFFGDGQGLAVPTSKPGQENQADCIAGATLAKAEQDGYLTVQEGDLDEIHEFLVALQDDTGTDHGTAEQRVGLFNLGYSHGDIESCLFNKGVPPSGWLGPA